MLGFSLTAIVLIALFAVFIVGAYLQLHGKLTSIEQMLHLSATVAKVSPPPAPHVVVVHTGPVAPGVAAGLGTATALHVPNTPPVATS